MRSACREWYIGRIILVSSFEYTKVISKFKGGRCPETGAAFFFCLYLSIS